MLTPEEVSEKIDKGWIKTKMWFELLAVDKKVTEDTLKAHVEKIKKEKDVFVLSEKFEETQRLENPFETVPEAFSQAVQAELLTRDIESLLTLVIFFAPSAIEILSPEKLTINMRTVQVVMNSVADLIHRYAAHGTGGVVVSTKK